MEGRFGPNTALVNAFIARLKKADPKLRALTFWKMSGHQHYEIRSAAAIVVGEWCAVRGRFWETADEIEAKLVEAGIYAEPALYAAIALANRHTIHDGSDFTQDDFATIYAPFQGEIPLESLLKKAAA